MKKILATVLMTFSSALLISLPAMASHQAIEVSVDGMVCDFCAQGIKKQFKKSSGVTGVDVDLDSKLVTLHLDHKAKISDDVITEKLKDAGFKVTSIK